MRSTPRLSALFDELEKISGVKSFGMNLAKKISGLGGRNEVLGLGLLAAPSADNMIAKVRARRAGVKGPISEHKLDKFRMIKEKYHDAAEVIGLGMLAAPYVGKRIHTGKWGH